MLLHDARPFIALIAGDEVVAVFEAHQSLLAVGSAPLAKEGLRGIGKGFEFLKRDKAMGRPFLFGVEGGSKSAHQSRDLWPDHRMAEFPLKASEDRIVKEGPALGDHGGPKLLRTMETDHLVD